MPMIMNSIVANRAQHGSSFVCACLCVWVKATNILFTLHIQGQLEEHGIAANLVIITLIFVLHVY